MLLVQHIRDHYDQVLLGLKKRNQVLKPKVSNSKRLWVTLAAFAVDAYLYQKGIEAKLDMMALGTGIAILNAPIMAYLGAESWKPSNKKQQQDETTKT